VSTRGNEEDTKMGTLSFGQLPLIAKVAVGIAFYDAWWSIEEFVIDRYGLWRYMPYYRVSDPCVWDLAVAVLIAVGLWRLARQRGTTASTTQRA
jgi:hypothetical protein